MAPAEYGATLRSAGMKQIQQKLLSEVIKRYPNAQPCDGKESLKDCFMYSAKNGWMLYFNYDKPDCKGTTSVLTEEELKNESKETN